MKHRYDYPHTLADGERLGVFPSSRVIRTGTNEGEVHEDGRAYQVRRATPRHYRMTGRYRIVGAPLRLA